MITIKQLMHRAVFTLLILVVLGKKGVFTNSYLSTLTESWLERLGIAPRDLRLFSSV